VKNLSEICRKLKRPQPPTKPTTFSGKLCEESPSSVKVTLKCNGEVIIDADLLTQPPKEQE
jgi:hypothetical protein